MVSIDITQGISCLVNDTIERGKDSKNIENLAKLTLNFINI